jgi:peptide/nickel transport system ATP-binding protein
MAHSNLNSTAQTNADTTPEPPLLEVKNLHTTFTTDEGTLSAVDGISFTIERSEFFGIVGESGSGKSVTARSIMRLLESNGHIKADTIRFKGYDLLELSSDKLKQIRGNDISIIFQDPMTGLNPVMTVGEQIAEVVRHNGDTGENSGFWSEMRRKYVTGTDTDSTSWQRAVELLDIVGIPDPTEHATEYPHQLSGGMKQRIMIAQALAGDPDLIIADEPTTALDVTIEAQILSKLLDLRDEFGVSILLITHDLAVVRETCDRVAVMYSGQLMEKALTTELFTNPSHPYTRGLLRSIPKASDPSDTLDAIPGQIPDPMNKPTGCPFRDRCPHAFGKCDQPLTAYSPAPTDPLHDKVGNDIEAQGDVDDIQSEMPTENDVFIAKELRHHPVYCHLFNSYVHTDENDNVISIDERFDNELAVRRTYQEAMSEADHPPLEGQTSSDD